MCKPVKVAACQVPYVREDVSTALEWIEQYAQDAERQEARLTCFPECFLQGYLTTEESARRNALDLFSPVFYSILKRLADFKTMLVFGVIEAEANAIFNTAVVISRGRLVGRYRKRNLLQGESLFRAGDSCPVFEIDGVTFGINICSDTQCPQFAAAVADQGARLILCPANNMMPRDKAEIWQHRHNEIRSLRASETGMWLVSADVTGEYGDSIALGPTAIIDPQGIVVDQIPLRQTGMIVTAIS